MKLRDRIKELRRVRSDELRPNPRNWRVHPEAQQNVLRGILAEVGIADAILARELEDGSLEIVDGHLRSELDGTVEWPVLVLDVTKEEADKLLATLDPLVGMAEPDPEKLEALLAEVSSESEAVEAMLKDLREEAGCLSDSDNDASADEGPQIDRAEELREQWGVESGQLWLIEGKAGVHRILCGDSTKVEDVERLMDGSRAQCIFTDPPYGVGIGAKNRLLNSVQKAGRCLEDIDSDSLSPEELKLQLLPAFELARDRIMADDCTLFVCAPQGGELGMMMMMMMQEACLKARHVLIWKKNQPTFSLGRLDYDYQHEPILLTWKARHKRPMKGNHRTSVWEIDRQRKCAEHPTMKPVDLYINAYLNHSEVGDNVADVYAGSGTMFVAAESVGNRSAFGMEISPAYVAVTLQRMQDIGCQCRLAE